ncbi:hypothetical protein [Pseudomonas sp. EA_105y_Pfl2_R69]|jgi:cation diffusion facilitator CzcD-associated flavoprotein CzcO|uniref:hypothetical protein n=1 Tax=Pseudomonas sp. EA_105y_Pfl2_R69 TaxID=3088683 RepID=UPI00403FA3C4
MSVEHLDVLVIGAGLSGVGAASHLMQPCPCKHFAIFEGRDALDCAWGHYRYWLFMADWCGEAAEPSLLSCRQLLMCTGYCRYEGGYSPSFKGRELFRSAFIHPQPWPQGLDFSGKNLVVIGSAATAITLVPTLTGPAHNRLQQRQLDAQGGAVQRILLLPVAHMDA